MQLLRRLLRQAPRQHSTRGLSTAELVGIIVIVGGLTFLPSLALGPIADHLAMVSGKLF